MTNSDEMVFGFPEFAATVFAAHGPELRLAYAHSQLANKMFAELPATMKKQQIVIYMLVRMTTTGWVELLTLVGHGAGLGAMKIARGMFESAVMAEYLRQFPGEIEDYVEYGHVIFYKRLKQHPGVASPEMAANMEKEYNRVKHRFEKNGRIRNQWNKYPISYMAAKVGRAAQYEISYSLAASIHHGNFEAMTAHLSGDKAKLDIDQPPSLEWVNQALASGHVYLLQALDTLNDCFKLGYDSQLKEAGEVFQKVWSEKRPRKK
jgi:hypothetical protein